MTKHKKTKNPILLAVAGLAIFTALAGLIALRQLNNPKSAFAATCTTTVNPGQSIESIANSAPTGAIVCVNDGTYTGNIVIRKSGITLTSVNKWGAKIVGVPDSNSVYTPALEVYTNNTTVSGLDITAPNNRSGLADTGSNNKLIGNHVHDIATNFNPCAGGDDRGGSGILMENGDNSFVNGNFVERIGYNQNCEYVQGIYATQPSSTITNNIVKNVDAFCIHLWHGAKTNYKIYNNVVDHCGVASGTSGITIGADPSEGGQVTNSYIANNIIMNSNRGIEENNASNNYYYNNINYNVTRDQLDVSCDSVRCKNNSTANPLLDANYRPTAGSPVINAGYAQYAPTTDYDGNNRTGIPDIGAYEYNNGSTVPTSIPTTRPTNTPAIRPSNTPTPRPNQPTATLTPQATPTPASGIRTINFDSAPLGALTTYTPDITWQSSAWFVSAPWEKFTTRNLSFKKDATQGTVTFSNASRIVSLLAYNGGNSSSIVTITCGSQTKTQTITSKANPVSITTGFINNCNTTTIKSSNGWDTNFDNLAISR